MARDARALWVPELSVADRRPGMRCSANGGIVDSAEPARARRYVGETG